MTERRIGFLVNPVAGLGGARGLHGTDRLADIEPSMTDLQWCTATSAGPAPHRARRAARALARAGNLRLVTVGGSMGEVIATEAGLRHEVVYQPSTARTTADDTRRGAAAIARRGVDALLFVGGDGTARDVCASVGTTLATVGVPSGVKMHSGVFAFTPEEAATAALAVGAGGARMDEVDVVDLDEDARARGDLATRAFGKLLLPVVPEIQRGKSGGPTSAGVLESIARELAARLRPDASHVFGPGTTVQAVGKHLGLELSLLGVDVERAHRVHPDVSADELIALTADHAVQVVVSPIGGQGLILGRGNQQIAGSVLEHLDPADLLIIGAPQKLAALGGTLRLDTPSVDLNRRFSGLRRVITGYRQESLISVR